MTTKELKQKIQEFGAEIFRIKIRIEQLGSEAEPRYVRMLQSTCVHLNETINSLDDMLIVLHSK